MADDTYKEEQEESYFKIVSFVTAFDYNCEICLHQKIGKVFNILYVKSGAPDVVVMDCYDIFFPEIRPTQYSGIFSTHMRQVKCCNMCYTKLIESIGKVMIKEGELKN